MPKYENDTNTADTNTFADDPCTDKNGVAWWYLIISVCHLLSRVTISLAEDCAARVHRLLTINNKMWFFFSDWFVFKHHLEVLARLSAKEIWSPVLSFFDHVLICEICPVVSRTWWWLWWWSKITSMMMVHKRLDNELSWIDYSRSTTLLELPSHLCKGLNKGDYS